MKECTCKIEYAVELSRLEVLTGLIELAQQQIAKGSPHTAGWADDRTVKRWMKIINSIRTALPECAIKDFDDARKKQKEFTAALIRNHDRGS